MTCLKRGKADIGWVKEYENLLPPFSDRTVMHVQKMYEAFGKDTVFGRSGVQAVKGYGKGKYRFQ